MASLATAWPESGPSNASVLLIFSHSLVVPQSHGGSELQLTQAGPPNASNRIPWGNHSSQDQAGEFGKKARVENSGGKSDARFAFVGS